MNFFKSIKFRLTSWYLVVIVIVLGLFGILNYFILSYNLNQNMDNYLKSRAEELAQSLVIKDNSFEFDERLSELVLFYNANGILSEKFGPNIVFSDINELVNKVLIGDSVFLTDSTTDGQEVRLFGIPYQNDSNRYAIIIGRSTAENKDVLNTFIRIIWISALSITIVAYIGGFFLASRALRPVNKMTKTARDISAKDLRKRIPVTTNDELGRLAVTLNQMIEGLEGAFDRQRQFAADASHELRTPLSVIRAEATLALSNPRTEAEYIKSLEVVSQEADHVSSIIDKLLFLARSDAGKEPLNYQDVNLKDLIIKLSEDMDILAKDKGIQFILGTIEELIVRGDRLKLRQLLISLIENAIRYTHVGSITITLTRYKNTAVIAVSDTGQGIPAEHLPHIFKRFYRVDKSRSRAEGGVGLGLAIAKSVVEAHEGTIEVESQENQGTTFRVTLPLLEESQKQV
jgi:heavy metal sensor kinase